MIVITGASDRLDKELTALYVANGKRVIGSAHGFRGFEDEQTRIAEGLITK